jgi:hypothetical protein
MKQQMSGQRRVFGKVKMLVTDLETYWKTKLRVAAEEWYKESGKQKGRKYFEY